MKPVVLPVFVTEREESLVADGRVIVRVVASVQEIVESDAAVLVKSEDPRSVEAPWVPALGREK